MQLVQNKYQFTPSKEADKLMLEYRKDISPVFGFIENCIEKDTKINRTSRFGSTISTHTIFNAYNRWCVENGIHDRITKRSFLKALREELTKSNIPFHEYYSGIVRYFTDIHLSYNIRKALNDYIHDDEDDFAEDKRSHYVVKDYEDDNEVA